MFLYLINLFKSLEVDLNYYSSSFLYEAAKNNRINILKYIADLSLTDNKKIMRCDIEGNHIDLIVNIIREGKADYNIGFIESVSFANISLINYFISAIQEASYRGNLNILRHLFNHMENLNIGINPETIDKIVWYNLIGQANIEVVEYILSLS